MAKKHDLRTVDTIELKAPSSSAGPDKLSGVVYERILARIASGEYSISTKLPTEHQLADEFSVSRPVVREALARLRDDGVVASRRGSGTYVLRAPSSAALKLAPISSIADMQRCFEFRTSFEGEAAYYAARTQDEEGSHMLTAALERLDTAVADNVLGAEEDFAFHLAIAQMTGNRFFHAIMASMHESIVTGITVTRSLSLMRPRERVIAVHDEHQEIYDAIRERDPDRARSAMRRHLENARRRVFEGTQG